MTKEELEKEAEVYADDKKHFDGQAQLYIVDGYLAGAEPREKRIAELEEKISILLSCKNCPENKGGFICQKEYEDKCLAQKIQYIKELKEENKVLAQNLEDTEILNKTYEKRFNDLEKENAELKEQISTKDILIKELQEQKVYWKESSFDWRHKFFKLDKVKCLIKKDKQLKQAKELLAKWVELFKPKGGNIPPTPIQVDTERFLSELEK